MKLSRRHFSTLLAAFTGGVLLPAPLLAGLGGERKFLFVFCRGGWDTTYVFTPMLNHASLVPEEGAELAAVSGIPFVNNESRPSVAAFFQEYAHRTCVLNGLEVRSVTHERCRQLILAGTASGGDDWPSTLAHHSTQERLVPHIVVAGPAYTAKYTSSVVRVGDNEQLSGLLDGSALQNSEIEVNPPPARVESLTDAFVAQRLEQAAASADSSQRSRYLSEYSSAVQRLDMLADYAVQTGSTKVGCRRNNATDAAIILDMFELGLARCGMIEDNGSCSAGWDTHEGNFMQDWHFEELFASLSLIMADLDSRPGEYSASLADEVTIVVFSEMGRHPVLNARGGKEHWTYTSAMLIGAGVAGGQSIGGLDDNGHGHPINLSTGQSSLSGVSLTGAHLGATLMSMGGLDPSDFLFDILPITAVMS